jgi:hypothetical protein
MPGDPIGGRVDHAITTPARTGWRTRLVRCGVAGRWGRGWGGRGVGRHR